MAIRLRDGTVIVAGGSTRGGEPVTSIERFDPATGQWAAAGIREGLTSGEAALLCDGTVLLAGGSTAQLYDPETERVTASVGLSADRTFGTLTSLLDGRALLAGGQSDDGAVVGAAELFGPTP